MSLWNAPSDMDYYDEQERFVPSVERDDYMAERDEYFAFTASVARQEAARIRAEREDEQDEPCPFGEVGK